MGQQFVVIKKDDNYFVCTQFECEALPIIRGQQNMALRPLEMCELKEGDLLVIGDVQIGFDGQKISLVYTATTPIL